MDSYFIKCYEDYVWCFNELLPTVSDTSAADIVLRAPMRTTAGESVCPAQHHVQTAGATRTALPVSLVTFSMVPLAKT